MARVTDDLHCSIPDQVLGAGGLLAEVLPEGEFEHRPEQLRFATAAARVLTRGGVLLAEAGTGTGKTLAYLTAALESGHRVVISTGTRALQDQIVLKDIPLLERVLGRNLEARCLKGLGNYLCLRRFDALRRLAPASLDGEEQELLHAIGLWASQSQTGDRSEIKDLPADLPLWGQINASTETRLGARCPFHDDCFVTRARAAAQEAQLLVVNHHLLFADLAIRAGSSEGGVLPAYDALVLDEAHQVDGTATTFFGYRVSARQLLLLAGEARLALALSGQGALEKGESWLASVESTTGEFFRVISAVGDGDEGRSELDPDDLTGAAVEASYWRLDAALEGFSAHLHGRSGGEGDEAAAGCARRADLIRDDLATILGREHRAAVYFRESSRFARGGAIGASPIDLSQTLRERLFYQVEGVVLTSATLATGGGKDSFSYIKARLGIDFDAAKLVVPSPFLYRDQAALYLPEDAPDPRDDGYVEAVAEHVERTCRLVGGGTLVLFTSRAAMRQVHSLLSQVPLGRALRVQGERPRHALLDELRGAQEPMVLLATASFWEGVDLPGDALELLVITRIPFSSPGEPVVAARLRALAEQGQNPFSEYQLPQAALTLKQGFGRLIRSRRDRGIVSILDRRIQTMPYGQRLLAALPRCTVVRSFDEVERWWADQSQGMP